MNEPEDVLLNLREAIIVARRARIIWRAKSYERRNK